MTKYFLNRIIYSLLLALSFLTSCNGQTKTHPQVDSVIKSKINLVGQPKLFRTQSSNQDGGVGCSLQDKAGNLWFGIAGEGVYRYDGKLFTQFTVQDGLNHNNVWSICEDKIGNIWLGTSDGVCRYDARLPTRAGSDGNDKVGQGKKFTPVTITINDGNSLQSKGSVRLKNKISVTNNGGVTEENSVWSIIQDKLGTLWFGTTDGIYRYDLPTGQAGGKIFSFFTHNDGISNNTGVDINKVESILEDRTGKIWFGGRFTDGLFCFDGKSLNHLKPDGDNWFVPRIEDKSGNIWFGTRMHNVYRYDGKSFTNYTNKELHGWVISMAEDNEGNLWFSTEKGVAKFDGMQMTSLTGKDGLKDDYIYNLMCDKSGTLWIGTRGLGLYSYSGKTLTDFSE
jgi:ligand-binding sensor domain-containing protein